MNTTSAQQNKPGYEVFNAGGTSSNVNLEQKVPQIVCYNNGFLVNSDFYSFSMPRYKEVWEQLKAGNVEAEIASYFKSYNSNIPMQVRVIAGDFAPSTIDNALQSAKTSKPPSPQNKTETPIVKYNLKAIENYNFSGDGQTISFMLDLLDGQRVNVNMPANCPVSELFKALETAGATSISKLLVGFPPRKITNSAQQVGSLNFDSEVVRIL